MSDVYLRPGDCFVGDRGQRLHTLLGSCVAITLWHPPSGAGGMCHFLLAHRPRPAAPDPRYGDDALQQMVEDLAALGVPARDCEAKVFGGAAMFGPRAPFQIGQRNGEAARELVARHGIPLRSQSLYGPGHRQIVFDLATGDAWVRAGRGRAGPHAESAG